LILGFVFFYRIASLPSGASREENNYVSSAQDIKSIYRAPANAPHKILALAESKSLKPSLTAYRVISSLFAMVIAVSFFVVCRHWFGLSVALMALAVFILSPFFIITARQSTPEILRYSPLILLAVYYWHLRTDKKETAWIVVMMCAAAILYIPGAFWWILASTVIARKKLLTTAGRISQPAAATGMLLFVLTIVPIIMAFVRDWRFVYSYLLIPQYLPNAIDFFKHLAWMSASLIVRAPYHDSLGISRSPMLSVIQIALAIFGGYALFSAARAKAWWLTASIIFGVLLAALNDDVRLLFFSLPAIGVFMAAGLRYLYIEWRSIFPKNPIPKYLAILLLASMVGIQAVYGITYSLIAWPASQETKAVYVIK